MSGICKSVSILGALMMLASCLGQADRIGAPTRVTVSPLTLAQRREVPLKLKNAGCSVGQSLAEGRSQVRAVARRDLPVQLPELSAMPLNSKGFAPFTIRTFSFGGDAAGAQVVVSCIVPMVGDYGNQLASAIETVPLSRWQTLLSSSTAVVVNARLSDGLAQALVKATFPKAKRVTESFHAKSATKNIGPGNLPTVNVTADYNYALAWVSFASLSDFFDQWDEVDALSDVFFDEEWAEECATYNSEFWKWYDTHAQAEAALGELESYFNDMATAMGSKTEEMENAVQVPCPENGPAYCLDAFIPNCWIGPLQGDCRTSDAKATAGQSRIQIELDPVTKSFTFKYNGTFLLYPCTTGVTPYLANICSAFLSDSAAFAGNNPISITNGPNGSFTVDVDIATSACLFHNNPLCPTIDTKITFTPSTTVEGGYAVTFNGDGSPAWDVFHRSSNGLTKVGGQSAPGNAALFFINLTGAINKVKQSLEVPPPGAPPGCYIE